VGDTMSHEACGSLSLIGLSRCWSVVLFYSIIFYAMLCHATLYVGLTERQPPSHALSCHPRAARDIIHSSPMLTFAISRKANSLYATTLGNGNGVKSEASSGKAPHRTPSKSPFRVPVWPGTWRANSVDA